MAHGEILGWLNSDDTYEPGAISEASNSFFSTLSGDGLWPGELPGQDGAFIGRYPSERFDGSAWANSVSCVSLRFSCDVGGQASGTFGHRAAYVHGLDYWLRLGQRYRPQPMVFFRTQRWPIPELYQETKTLGQRDTVYHEVARTVASMLEGGAKLDTRVCAGGCAQNPFETLRESAKPIFVFAGCFLI